MSEFYNQTTLHPLGLALVLVLGAAMLVVPRRWAVLPMVIMAAFVAPAQRLVVADLDFNLLRIMVLFGWIRVILNGELMSLRWRTLDTMVVAWTVTGSMMYSFLHMSSEAVVNRLGYAYEALGMYFLFRALVREPEDIYAMMRGVAVVIIPVAIAFMIERSTGRNAFAFFGGVPEVTVVRDGRLRCQGAFAHAILAGCFWAALMPLAVALWMRNRGIDRWAASTVLLCSLLIIFLCSSATPVMAVLALVMGLGAFLVRRQLWWMRWGLLLLAIPLHFVMNKGIHHLFVKIRIAGGTGWHRYHLIDQAINHFGEWAAFGTRSTAHWGYGLDDVTNQYISEGVRGGLLTMALCIATIVVAFRAVGRMTRRSEREGNMLHAGLVWCLGTAIFVHIVNFLAVSYFGQILMLWYLQLAMVASLEGWTFPRRVASLQNSLPRGHAGVRPRTAGAV